MFARRASCSAVWKATSSRWSTTYWATSFCERENSSKRAEMYVESVWWPRAAGGMVAVLGMARRPFDGRSLTSSPQCNGLRLDSTASCCSHRRCTATRAASSWRRFAPTRRARHGIPTEFVQDNHSRSARARCAASTSRRIPARASSSAWRAGACFDVVVDLRRGSPTFGEWEGVELDDESGEMLWIPVGFGHGFLVLSEVADFVYKCTNYYDPATEAGIRFDDPEVGIEWPSEVELLYSQRDADGADAGRGRGHAAFHGVNGATHPSPTGVLHLGNLRTALLAWLFARSGGVGVHGAGRGSRHGRVRRSSSRSSCATCAAIGLDWDGEVRRAVRARRRSMSEALERLPVYECFCTRAEIREAASAAHGPVGRLSGDVPAG